MRHLIGTLMMLMLLAGVARAEPDTHRGGDRGGDRGADLDGDFDYWILALSWAPSWCAREGDARGADTCDAGSGAGWTLHGLWPQYDTGWPEFCATDRQGPSRRENDAMADIQGSGGLAGYQWRKHGACSGLSGRDYHRLARDAYGRVNRPALLRQLTDPVRLPASVIEAAFLEANPDWTQDMLTITCADGAIAEARLCLTRELAPRPCGADVARDCTLDRALFPPLR